MTSRPEGGGEGVKQDGTMGALVMPKSEVKWPGSDRLFSESFRDVKVFYFD